MIEMGERYLSNGLPELFRRPVFTRCSANGVWRDAKPGLGASGERGNYVVSAP